MAEMKYFVHVTMKELLSGSKWTKEHFEEKHPDRLSYHDIKIEVDLESGIGGKVTLECKICKETTDVTDFDCW